jgi:type VI secretion system protein ImpC
MAKQATRRSVATEQVTYAPEPGSLLEKIITEGNMARHPDQTSHARDLIAEFAAQVVDEGMSVSRDTAAMINARIAQIDELMSGQLNQIMHAPEFQTLEASWRGLAYLVMNTETSTHLKLRLLNASRAELQKDLEKAVEFDQSVLFKKIYEEEYGTFGGHPFSLLVGDFEFGRHPEDVAFLEKMSNVAAAAHTPFISAASPKLFDLDSFTGLATPRDLAKQFESSELAKWRSFRACDDARYVTLTLPHILMRLPYGPNTKPTEGVNFVEDVDGTNHSKYLWGNAAYALSQRITDAFAKHSWCAAIRGVEGGGLVEGLPTHTFKTDQGDVALKCPTEIAITDRRENELNDLGFVCLCHCKGTDFAAFFGGATTNKPKKYVTNDANANARISAMLPYVLAASRFAHYLKVIMRDKIGSFATRENVEQFLNNWISQYVLLNDDAPQVVKAKYPLREGRVDVTEIAGKPGAYNATVFLRPHFQLEELSASIRLVAELPAGAA